MMISRIFSIFLLFQILFFDIQAQAPAANADFWQSYKAFNASYEMAGLRISDRFAAKGKALGEVTTVKEASGIVMSVKNPGMLWVHNDSGNPNVIFLLDKNDGSEVARYRLNGINNIDWEDIEIGPGPDENETYLYLADIGDNKAKRPQVQIYRFAEPVFEEAHRGKLTELEPEKEAIRLKYPDGARDAETLLLDPRTRDIYVVSKRELRVGIYIAPYPQNTEEATELRKLGNIPVMFATGGNISADGQNILVRTYHHIYNWQRKNDEPLWETFQRQPERLPYDPMEAQGEAICWDDEGGYYTLSEHAKGVVPQLYYYKKQID